MILDFCEGCKCKDFCLSREPNCACCGLFNIINSREVCALGHDSSICKFICDDALMINEPCTDCLIDKCPKNIEYGE